MIDLQLVTLIFFTLIVIVIGFSLYYFYEIRTRKIIKIANKLDKIIENEKNNNKI